MQNGILINMEHIDHVKINKQTGIVTVGGGTVYEQVINATYAAGREMSVSILNPHLRSIANED